MWEVLEKEDDCIFCIFSAFNSSYSCQVQWSSNRLSLEDSGEFYYQNKKVSLDVLSKYYKYQSHYFIPISHNSGWVGAG